MLKEVKLQFYLLFLSKLQWFEKGIVMKRLEVTCNGCDHVEHVNLPVSDQIDLMFDGWISHRAVVYENGLDSYEIAADLCPECANKMRHAINPANWPRIKAVRESRARRVA